MNDLSFFSKHSPAHAPQLLETPPYTFRLFRPTLREPLAPGLGWSPYAVWSLLSFLRVFRNRDYHALLIYDGETLIHRSLAMPGYFRYPFMDNDDLNIGDVWTARRYRGQGLAKFAFREIMRRLGHPGRTFWYICEASNKPSIRAAKGVGFRRLAGGRRVARLGIGLLGAFELDLGDQTGESGRGSRSTTRSTR